MRFSSFDGMAAQQSAGLMVGRMPEKETLFWEIGYPDLAVFEGSQPPGFQ